MTRLTVVCVLRSGGPKFSTTWVRKLHAGVARHLRRPHDFVCLTDILMPGVDCEFLRHDWPGWWAKLEIFRPGLFTGRVLYLDLDTLVTGDLSDVARYDGPFAGLSDFYRPDVLASGVLAWDGAGDAGAAVYEAFCADPVGVRGRYPSVDPWLRTVAPHGAGRLNDLYPGQIVSAKVHARRACPPDARLVCFHGRPTITDLPPTHWARALWQAL